MPLVIQTGRQLTIEIATVNYSVQTAEVTLTPSQTVDQYISLTGKAAKAQPVTWELNVKSFQDWGEATSFAEAMVTAAAAGTHVAFELGLPGGATAAGYIIPVYPSAGGAADSALELDMTFAVDGDVTFTL
jgi:hypothetical protein